MGNSDPSDSDFGYSQGGNTTSKQRTSNAAQTDRSNKARNSRLEKERLVAFDQGGRGKNFPPEYKENAGNSVYSQVSRNVALAEDLEYKAKNTNFMGKERGKNFSIFGKDLGFNLMDTSIVGMGLDAVQKSNYRGQADKLRAGGKPVYGDKGAYQGVVSKNFFGLNAYSGNADYSPIGRSQGSSYNSSTGTYTSSKMQEDPNQSDSQVSNSTPSNTQASAQNRTDSTSSLNPETKRKLAGNAASGGTSRREFFREA